MGCNCKSVEKLKKTQLFSTKNERIGVWGRINAMSLNFINKFIILSLLIILTPIVIIVLIINFLFGNGLMLPLPKFMSKYLKKIKENE
jgi:hypothetical protein